MLERSDTLNNQAIILASDGAYTEAIACFKRAIVIDKNNYLLWFNLGVTYRDAGKLEEAENALEISREGMGNRNPHQVLRWPFFETVEKMVNSRILR